MNQELVEVLRVDIEAFRNKAEIILLGDMNVHTQGLDGYTEDNGKLMVDLSEQRNLVIVNTGPKWGGHITSYGKPEIGSRTLIDV